MDSRFRISTTSRNTRNRALEGNEIWGKLQSTPPPLKKHSISHLGYASNHEGDQSWNRYELSSPWSWVLSIVRFWLGFFFPSQEVLTDHCDYRLFCTAWAMGAELPFGPVVEPRLLSCDIKSLVRGFRCVEGGRSSCGCLGTSLLRIRHSND